MKKWISLLLALMMVLSLAACSGGGDSAEKSDASGSSAKDVDTLDDAKAEDGDYTIAVDAVQQLIDAPSLKHYARLAGGKLCADEVYDVLAAYMKLTSGTEDTMLMNAYLYSSTEGSKITDSTGDAADEFVLRGYQSDLERFQDTLDRKIDNFSDFMDEQESESWADYEGSDLSPEEAQQAAQELLDALNALRDVVKGISFDEANMIELSLEGGDKDEVTFGLMLNDGAWFTDELFRIFNAMFQL